VPFHLLPKGPPTPLPDDHFIFEYQRRCKSGYYTDNNAADVTVDNLGNDGFTENDLLPPPPPPMCDLSADAQSFVPSALVPPAPAIYYNHCCFYLQADRTSTTVTKTDNSCQADFAYFTWHTAPVTPTDTITDLSEIREISAAKVCEATSCQTDAIYHSTTEKIFAAKVYETTSCQTDATYHNTTKENTGYTTIATARDNETPAARDNKTPVTVSLEIDTSANTDYTITATKARDNETPNSVSLEIDPLAADTFIEDSFTLDDMGTAVEEDAIYHATTVENTDYTTLATARDTVHPSITTQARDNETPVSVSLEIDTFAAEFVNPRSSYMEIDTFAAETIIEDSFTDDISLDTGNNTGITSEITDFSEITGSISESPFPCHHGLKRFITENVGYLCDVCHTTVDKSAEMWGCRECNFDVCLGCPGAETFPAEIDETVEEDTISEANATFHEHQQLVDTLHTILPHLTAQEASQVLAEMIDDTTDSENDRQCDDTPTAGFAASSPVPGLPRASADGSADTSGTTLFNLEFLSGL